MNILKHNLVVLVTVVLLNNANTLKVSVYYETLCADSTRFITEQLYPDYNAIADYIDLDFVPYGKATHEETNGVFKFSCQHGAPECKGNKYHSCVLSLKNGQLKDVQFLNCIMKSGNAALFSNIETCARTLSLDVSKIKSCSESIEGDKLLAQNGNKTWKLEPSLSYVPTVIYDDKYDDLSQWQSFSHFVPLVCSKLNGTKPSICENKKLPPSSLWGY